MSETLKRLAKLIAETPELTAHWVSPPDNPRDSSLVLHDDDEIGRRAAAAILPAGWRPPVRIITSWEELDALPVDSVVRRENSSAEYSQTFERQSSATAGWATAGDEPWHPAMIIDPSVVVTVLFEPEETQP